MPEVEDYLRAREGRVGIAAVLPSLGTVYSLRGDQKFQMASVAKIVIMGAVTHRAFQQGRDLTDAESSLLDAMITVSDNDAADALWIAAGGAAGIAGFLEELGVEGIDLDPQGYWGDSQASPEAVAQLLAKVGWDPALDPLTRDTAVELMGRISPEQAWGVTAGIEPELSGSVRVVLKNGWYPQDGGWVVNSAGLVLPADHRERGYSLVVMADGQPTLDYGIETVETVASMVHRRLLR